MYFYVMNPNFDIVSKHTTRAEAEAACVGRQFVCDPDGARAIMYGPSRAHLNR